jgi:hypothetical protein
MKTFFKFFIMTAVVFICIAPRVGLAAPVTYTFESDTIGQVPANTTVGGGSFDVTNDDLLGKSLRAVTQDGVIAAINFNSFPGSSDQSVVWKQSYSTLTGRGGFTLRSQSQDTGVANSAGAKKGYLFHVYDSSSVYIWRVDAGTYTMLWSGSLPKSEPRWFKATAVGNQLSFLYSNDGTNYTSLASVSDSTYTSGFVQYTAGYGSAVNQDFIDDVVITNLDLPSVVSVDSSSPDGAYKDGDTVHITVKFTEPVDLTTGTAFLNLNTGSIANYASGNGTDTLTFDYYVWFGLNNAHLNVYQINLNGDTITDSATGLVNADLTIANGYNLGDNANIVIDNTAPTLETAEITGEHEITITYSEIISNNTSVNYSNFSGAIAGHAITGQSGNSGTDHIVLTFDGASLYNQGNAILDISNTVADLAGNTFAGVTALSIDGVDTVTDPISSFTITPPAGASHPTTGTITFSFELPEPMLSGTLKLVAIPSGGSPITIDLSDVTDNTPITRTLTLSDLISSAGVVATTGDALLAETYTFALSYQDALGNSPETTSIAGVVIAVPVVSVSYQGGVISGGGSFINKPPFVNTIGLQKEIIPVYNFSRIIRMGMKGEDVKMLQMKLNMINNLFASLNADGAFGPNTKQALIKFQKSKGIKADGVLGPKTRAMIEKELNK